MSTKNIDKNQNVHGANSQQLPMNEINTTPLIDVLLVLVIIFIITAPIITSRIDVNLPTISASANPEKPEAITLAVNGEGKIFVNDQEVALEEISQALIAAKKDKEAELRLKIDETTQYVKIAKILEQAKKSGITKLSFVNRVVSQ